MGGNKSKQQPPSYKRGKLYDDTPTARRKIVEMQDGKYQRGDLARLIKKATKGKAPAKGA